MSYREEMNYLGDLNQGYQPYQGRYRPGFQGQSAPSMTTNEDLRVMIQNLARNQEIAAHTSAMELKGIRAHLNDLEVWKEGISSQVAGLAESMPRPIGRLPGQLEESLRNRQVAAMSIVEISSDSSEEEVESHYRPVRYERSTGRGDSSIGR